MSMASYKAGLTRTFFLAAVGLLASLYLTGCGQSEPKDDLLELRGLVSYRERISLPGSARLEVELQDVTNVGATPEILGRTVVENAGQIPIGFVVVFNASKFEQGHIYAVRAAIYDGNRMLFTTDETYPADLENLKGLLEIVLMKAN
jgi:uncharacterized lipoprotein YbaY